LAVHCFRFFGSTLGLLFCANTRGVMIETASRRMGRIELEGYKPLLDENTELESGAVTTGSHATDRGGNTNRLRESLLNTVHYQRATKHSLSLKAIT
jgi:hypothetical protein